MQKNTAIVNNFILSHGLKILAPSENKAIESMTSVTMKLSSFHHYIVG